MINNKQEQGEPNGPDRNNGGTDALAARPSNNPDMWHVEDAGSNEETHTLVPLSLCLAPPSIQTP